MHIKKINNTFKFQLFNFNKNVILIKLKIIQYNILINKIYKTISYFKHHKHLTY